MIRANPSSCSCIFAYFAFVYLWNVQQRYYTQHKKHFKNLHGSPMRDIQYAKLLRTVTKEVLFFLSYHACIRSKNFVLSEI